MPSYFFQKSSLKKLVFDCHLDNIHLFVLMLTIETISYICLKNYKDEVWSKWIPIAYIYDTLLFVSVFIMDF